DALRARIKPNSVIGRREHHALDAGAARRLEQIVAADDIGVEDRLPRSLDGMTAEMNDTLDAGDRLLDLREIGEIGGDKVIAGGKIRGLADIARPKMRIDAAQNLAQSRADIAGSAGNENVLHHLLQDSNGIRIRHVASPSLHFCPRRSML